MRGIGGQNGDLKWESEQSSKTGLGHSGRGLCLTKPRDSWVGGTAREGQDTRAPVVVQATRPPPRDVVVQTWGAEALGVLRMPTALRTEQLRCALLEGTANLMGPSATPALGSRTFQGPSATPVQMCH